MLTTYTPHTHTHARVPAITHAHTRHSLALLGLKLPCLQPVFSSSWTVLELQLGTSVWHPVLKARAGVSFRERVPRADVCVC